MVLEVTDVVYQGGGMIVTFNDGSVGNAITKVVRGVITYIGLTPGQSEALSIFNAANVANEARAVDPRLGTSPQVAEAISGVSSQVTTLETTVESPGSPKYNQIYIKTNAEPDTAIVNWSYDEPPGGPPGSIYKFDVSDDPGPPVTWGVDVGGTAAESAQNLADRINAVNDPAFTAEYLAPDSVILYLRAGVETLLMAKSMTGEADLRFLSGTHVPASEGGVKKLAIFTHVVQLDADLAAGTEVLLFKAESSQAPIIRSVTHTNSSGTVIQNPSGGLAVNATEISDGVWAVHYRDFIGGIVSSGDKISVIAEWF
jgi:hypothetical protein